jgi:hypothetical protein
MKFYNLLNALMLIEATLDDVYNDMLHILCTRNWGHMR